MVRYLLTCLRLASARGAKDAHCKCESRRGFTWCVGLFLSQKPQVKVCATEQTTRFSPSRSLRYQSANTMDKLFE
jgi:hypothetical protein